MSKDQNCNQKKDHPTVTIEEDYDGEECCINIIPEQDQIAGMLTQSHYNAGL